MTLLFADGFDHYVTAEGSLKYPTFTSATIGSGDGRYNGGNALNCSSSFSGPIFYLEDQAFSELIIGFAFRPTSNTAQTIFRFYNSHDSTFKMSLYYDVIDRRLELSENSPGNSLFQYIVTPYGSVQLNQWYYVELKTKFGFYDGSATLVLNGETMGTVENVETVGGVNQSFEANGFRLTGLCEFDDLYFSSTEGTVNDDFLGDIVVDTKFPMVNGLTNGWQQSGASFNYDAVNENPADDDTTFVTTAGLNVTDFYTMDAITATSGVVKGVAVTAKARRENTGTRSIAMLARAGGLSGTISDDSLTHPLLATYEFHQNVVEDNPDTGIPWTISEVDSSEFGIRSKGS